MMTNQDLKRRLKELKVEELALRKDIKDLSKITKQENFEYIKVVREQHMIKRTLDKRKKTKLTLADLLLSCCISLNLLTIPYLTLTKLALILMNTLFLFLLMRSARSTIQTCYRENLVVWIACAEKTLPEWKTYHKQMKSHLICHLVFIGLWFVAFNLIIPSAILNQTTVAIAIGCVLVGWFMEYRKTNFNETIWFLKVAKQIIALDHPNLYQNLD